MLPFARRSCSWAYPAAPTSTSLDAFPGHIHASSGRRSRVLPRLAKAGPIRPILAGITSTSPRWTDQGSPRWDQLNQPSVGPIRPPTGLTRLDHPPVQHRKRSVFVWSCSTICCTTTNPAPALVLLLIIITLLFRVLVVCSVLGIGGRHRGARCWLAIDCQPRPSYGLWLTFVLSCAVSCDGSSLPVCANSLFVCPVRAGLEYSHNRCLFTYRPQVLFSVFLPYYSSSSSCLIHPSSTRDFALFTLGYYNFWVCAVLVGWR